VPSEPSIKRWNERTRNLENVPSVPYFSPYFSRISPMQVNLMARLWIAGIVGVLWAGCQRPAPPPPDLHVETLNVPTAANRSDLILLAVPLSHRDVRVFANPWRGVGEPKRQAEVETTLKVLRVIKGPPLPAEVRFRAYYGRDYFFVTGMPKGPAPIGLSAIFFLERRPNGILRSSVDGFRPEFATHWVTGPVEPEPCPSPQDCMAEILLRYRQADDAQAYADGLDSSVGICRRLIGFFRTFDLLTNMASTEQHPAPVKREACSELTKSYNEFELPPACASLIGSTHGAKDSATYNAVRREYLKKAGLAWVRERIGSDNEGDVRRYLQLMKKSPDNEIRRLATSLLAEL
jgi:hypothetical protein